MEKFNVRHFNYTDGKDAVKVLAPEWKQKRASILKKAKNGSVEDRIESILLIGSLAVKADNEALEVLMDIIQDMEDCDLLREAAEDAFYTLKC